MASKALHISNPEIDSERLFNGGKTAFLVDPITSPSDGIALDFFSGVSFLGNKSILVSGWLDLEWISNDMNGASLGVI